MKRLLVIAGAAALLAAGQANAADLPVKAPVYKAPPPIIAAYSWTGCYIGAHAGWGWGKKRWYDDIVGDSNFGALWGEPDVDGGLAGGQVGCDYQTGPWVLGIEGTGSWTDIKGDAPYIFVNTISVNSKVEWLATVTGRLGYAVDRALFYVKGGGAFAHEKHWWSGSFVTDQPGQDRSGWLVGGGIEYAFAPNWSLKAEYNYIDFGSKDVTHTELADPDNVFNTRIKQQLHIAKVGLNYRFGGPVVAKY